MVIQHYHQLHHSSKTWHGMDQHVPLYKERCKNQSHSVRIFLKEIYHCSRVSVGNLNAWCTRDFMLYSKLLYRTQINGLVPSTIVKLVTDVLAASTKAFVESSNNVYSPPETQPEMFMKFTVFFLYLSFRASFWPEYRHIQELQPIIAGAPRLMLTATANKGILHDIFSV